MSRRGTKRGVKEATVDEWKIEVGQKYECRYNNNPEDKMVPCITKQKNSDGTWLVQYSGQSTQVIVDECNISAKNGNVFVPHSTPERGLKKAARDKKNASAVKPVDFEDMPVVVAIENTTLVARPEDKSASEGANVMAPVNFDTAVDLMKEIHEQGKFGLGNNERFKDLAIIKLKEAEEGWGTFELNEWLLDLKHVAELAPDPSLCDWILKQANAIYRTFVKKKERTKEGEPALQLNENEKGEVSEKMEQAHVAIQKASPKTAEFPKIPVALAKLHTSIKVEGDMTNTKFDELPSNKAYVVVLKKALYAGPDTEGKETNAFNRGLVRSRVLGTQTENQARILKGCGADPRQFFGKALF